MIEIGNGMEIAESPRSTLPIQGVLNALKTASYGHVFQQDLNTTHCHLNPGELLGFQCIIRSSKMGKTKVFFFGRMQSSCELRLLLQRMTW
jgi:hypothetical protein